MRYILLIAVLLFTGCGMKVIRSQKIEPVNNQPIVSTFKEIDTDLDGSISAVEFAELRKTAPEIDISTPLNVFMWIALVMMIVCVLSASIPKLISLVRCHRSREKCHIDDTDERTLLNE